MINHAYQITRLRLRAEAGLIPLTFGPLAVAAQETIMLHAAAKQSQNPGGQPSEACILFDPYPACRQGARTAMHVGT